MIWYNMPPKNAKSSRKKNFNRNYKRARAKVVEKKRRESAKIQIRNSTNGAGSTFSANYPDTTKFTNLSTSTGVNLLPLRSFYRMSRGERGDQMQGVQIYSHDLYLKGQISDLKNQYFADTGPAPIFFVAGWVKDKLGFTDYTTPTVATATRSDLENFVLAQVKQHFDDQKDEMRYREAKKDNIKITKYQRLRNPEQDDYNHNIKFDCHWSIKRKTTYTKCADLAGNNDLIQNSSSTPGVTIDMTDQFKEDTDQLGGDKGGFLPLESWLPFALIYAPNFTDFESNSPPQVKFNDIHYFTDA
jgi:hypothetical protein